MGVRISNCAHIYTTAKLPYTYRVLCVLYRYTSTGDLKLPFRNKTHSSDTSTPDRYPQTSAESCRVLRCCLEAYSLYHELCRSLSRPLAEGIPASCKGF